MAVTRCPFLLSALCHQCQHHLGSCPLFTLNVILILCHNQWWSWSLEGWCPQKIKPLSWKGDLIGTHDDSVLAGLPYTRQEGKALAMACHHSATWCLPVPMDNPLCPTRAPERRSYSRLQHAFVFNPFSCIFPLLQVLKHLLRDNVA